MHLSDDEIDDLILSAASQTWQKTAMIIAHVFTQTDEEEARIAERIYALVDARKMEAAGNIERWRESEVRLPKKQA